MVVRFIKGHGNETDFGFVCINWFGIGPLHNCSSLFDFGVEFVKIFVICYINDIQ